MGAVHPPGELERAVVEKIHGIGSVAPIAANIKIYSDWIIGWKRDQLIKMSRWAFELALKDSVTRRPHTELVSGSLTGVERFGVFERLEDEGVL